MSQEIVVEVLKKEEVFSFWQVFALVLKTEFPGYTEKVIKFFLEKIYSPSAFFYWLNHQLKTVLVAKINRETVGFAVIDEPYGGVSLCRWLGVKKEFQKQGIGKKLIQSWINLALSQGCHKIEVASQPEAKEFYKKVGLELEGKRKLSYFGIDQFIFGKIINKPNEQAMIK